MKKSRKYILILLIFLITCPSYSADTLSSEDYKVYSAVLENIRKSKPNFNQDSKRTILIDEITFNFSYDGEGIKWDSSQKYEKFRVNQEAIRNRSSRESNLKLDSSLFSPNNHDMKFIDFNKLSDSMRLANNDDEIFWKIIPQRFPGCFGYFTFSQIGYNQKRDTSILIYSYCCGNLCSEIYLVQLKKVKEVWEMEWRTLIGMS